MATSSGKIWQESVKATAEATSIVWHQAHTGLDLQQWVRQIRQRFGAQLPGGEDRLAKMYFLHKAEVIVSLGVTWLYAHGARGKSY